MDCPPNNGCWREVADSGGSTVFNLRFSIPVCKLHFSEVDKVSKIKNIAEACTSALMKFDIVTIQNN